MKLALEERLSTLDIPVPDTLIPGVLARARRVSRPHRGRLPLWVRATFAALVLVVALAGGSYFAPRFAQTLAETPVAGGLIGPALRSVGLAGLQGRFTALDSTSTSSGYTVRLVAGYADKNQTILVLHVQPPDAGFLGIATLTDQFGRELSLSGAVTSTQTGETLMIASGVPWPDSILGVRLTLRLTTLVTSPAAAPVKGDWKLQGTVSVEGARSLALPGAGTLDDSTFRFTSVEATSATLSIRMAVTGPLASQLDREVGEAIPNVAKPHPAFAIELLDGGGHTLNEITESSSGVGPAEIKATWVLVTKGTYRLVVRYEGVGQFERLIAVS